MTDRRAKNQRFARVERLAIQAHRHQTKRRHIPHALTRDLRQAQRDYAQAVLVIRRRQWVRRWALDRELTKAALALVGRLHTGKGGVE